ncbi:MAG TPA: 4Fe-4S dicluster domain-containing protein [Candidatus Latescibacteria bacterium]|nr:4Fe-4S dicluster domain-containing protein [Candidatus Latescibacterota bacterium]
MSDTATKPKKAAAKKKAAEEHLVPIFVMGKRYDVPDSLTIQKALEYAGYLLVRGCGCRGGICGACGTVYRFPNSYRIEVGLACQTVVQPDMYIAQIPFFPGNKAVYDIETLPALGSTISALYPEVFKCVGCGTCTRSCPMDIDVLGYISKAIQGDIKAVAEGSFDCVMCGLCAARCPSEEVQYNIAILARRLYARHIIPKAKHLEKAVKAVEDKTFEKALRELKKKSLDELKTLYKGLEGEPDIADESWTPKNKSYLGD